jgi:hypothetical protein
MILRRKRGATLGLVAAIALLLVFIGFTIFFVAQFLGGGKQVANATDAGAITAAKELEAVTVDLNTLTFVGTPVELEGLGVNTKSGAPDTATTLYNIYAYNRAVGAAMLMCANAEAENTPASAANAATIVSNLQTIGTALTGQLNTAIGASGNQVWNAFQTTAYSNNVDMMGHGAGTVATLENLQPGWIGSTDAAGNQTGKANVYFNSKLAATFVGGYLPPFPGSGVNSNTQASYASTLAGSQSGQSFIPGYTKIDYGAGIGGPGLAGVLPFYAVAVNPDQYPHLVDVNRFANGTKAPNGANAATANIPFNSIQGSTQTQETMKTNMFTTALASAVIGTANNMYPVTVGHGFVLLTNDHGYKYNTGVNQPPQLLQVPPGVDSTIFNNELYEGSGGAIDTYNSSTAPDGEVFGVESGPSLDTSTPAGAAMGNVSTQMSTWWSPYLASTGSDAYGHDENSDPTGGQLTLGAGNYYPSNTYVVNGTQMWIQNNNARVAPPGSAGPHHQNIVQATAVDMANVTGLGTVTSCHDLVYHGAPPSACSNQHLNDFQNSFGDGSSPGVPYSGDGGATGGLTTLEYLKGLVITAFNDMVTGGSQNPYYTATIPSNSFQFPVGNSGSRIYNREAGYAQPSNTATIQFGTAGTPYALLQQIVNGSQDPATAANATTCPGNIDLSVNSPLWNQPASVQGQLLQRIMEIDPNYTVQQLTDQNGVTGLLDTGPGLNLGQSDVIYWDTTSQKVVMNLYDPTNSATLATFPAWLQTQLTAMSTATSPTVYLDGNPTPPCSDQPWDSLASGTVVNAQAGAGTPVNTLGDYDLHDAPFSSVSGSLGTEDKVTWTANSGRGGALGQLLFQQESDLSMGGGPGGPGGPGSGSGSGSGNGGGPSARFGAPN